MFNVIKSLGFSSKLVSKLALSVLSLSCGLFLVGCETTDTAVVEQDAPATVSKGMSENEVLAILGEPQKVDKIEEGGVVAEIWHYEKEVVLSSTIESDGEQERVFVDHATGKFVTVREPIYRNESIKGTIVAELLMVDGKVVALKETEGVAEIQVGAGR